MFYRVFSFENSPWAGLARILGRCLRNYRRTLMCSVCRCLFSWEGFPRQTCKDHLCRKQGCCPEKASPFSAQLTAQNVGVCRHTLQFYLTQAMVFCHVRGCGAEKVACPADTLNKSRHKPGQQGPNGRSISLAKRTAQLPSLNLVNRMCLFNSDIDVQSVGYKSAQSPTNWEFIHGKDPSILC